MKKNFTGQIYMPDLKHNKEFIECYQKEYDNLIGRNRPNPQWGSLFHVEEYKNRCRRMAHVAALKKLYWEKKTA